MRKFANFGKGEIPDVAHRENYIVFVMYAYPAASTQFTGRFPMGTVINLKLTIKLCVFQKRTFGKQRQKKELNTVCDLDISKLICMSDVPAGRKRSARSGF